MKKRKKKKRKETDNYEGKRYIDYIQFVKDNTNLLTTKMDTVYNHQEDEYIQTFIFENTGLMIDILKQ